MIFIAITRYHYHVCLLYTDLCWFMLLFDYQTLICILREVAGTKNEFMGHYQ
jgi:hypothetical protein